MGHGAPGVYQKEVSSGNKPVTALSTSNIFALVHSDFGIPNKVKECTNETDIEKYFGGYRTDGYSRYAIRGAIENEGKHLYCCRVVGTGARYARGADDEKKAASATPTGEVTADSAILTDASANFVSVSKIIPGDILLIETGLNKGAYLISEVTDDTHLEVSEDFGTTETSLAYSIVGTSGEYGHIAVKSKHPGDASDNFVVEMSLERTGTTVRVTTSLEVGGVSTLLETKTGLKPGTAQAGFIDTVINDDSEFIEIDTDVPVEVTTGSDGVTVGTVAFTSAGSTFLTDGVAAGDLVIISSGAGIGVYSVSVVVSETELTLDRTATAATGASFSVQGKDADGTALIAMLASDVTVEPSLGVDDIPTKTEYIGAAAGKTGVYAFDNTDKIGTLIVPDAPIVLDSVGADATDDLNSAMIDYCAARKDWMYAYCSQKGETPTSVLSAYETAAKYSNFAAFYYPWIKVNDPLSGGTLLVPPVGHITGMYARVDAGAEGVHKAPANELLYGALDVEYDVTETEQESLNPVGINCIRNVNGIRAYGARTTSKDPEWVWIHKRRAFIMFWKSIKDAMDWTVFEVRAPSLWGGIIRNCDAFFRKYDRRTVRNGALLNPDDSTAQGWYVICDESINPPGESYTKCKWGVCIVETNEWTEFETSLWDGKVVLSTP